MDNELNNLNEFLGDLESSIFPPYNQLKTTRKGSVDFRHEGLISPQNNQFPLRGFNLHSPSPIKHNLNFYD